MVVRILTQQRSFNFHDCNRLQTTKQSRFLPRSLRDALQPNDETAFRAVNVGAGAGGHDSIAPNTFQTYYYLLQLSQAI
jgi:hypothetical protein